MEQDKVFSFIKGKKKRKILLITIIIAVTIFLFNICIQMILINSENLKQGLLTNNDLMVIQMFGYSEKENTYFLDSSKAESIEDVVFVSQSFPLTLAVYDANGTYIDEDVVLHRIPAEHSNYIGIDEMEDDVIYCPSDSFDVEEGYTLEAKYMYTDIKLQSYEEKAPAVFQGEDFVTCQTFDALMEREPYKHEVYTTPEYIIGVSDTRSVYGVIKELEKTYEGYDLQFFYQANGLEGFVDGSYNMLKLQYIILGLLWIISIYLIVFLLSAIVDSLKRELMIIHINGVSRTEIEKNFFSLLIRGIRKPCVMVMIFMMCIYFVMIRWAFPNLLDLGDLLFVMIMNGMLIGTSIASIRLIIRKRIRMNTSNEQITGMLRN